MEGEISRMTFVFVLLRSFVCVCRAPNNIPRRLDIHPHVTRLMASKGPFFVLSILHIGRRQEENKLKILDNLEHILCSNSVGWVYVYMPRRRTNPPLIFPGDR